MSNAKLQDLNEGSSQAINALLSSITPDRPAGQLTPDAVKKLSEKLKELVGEDALKGFSQTRNETGELVNEEGLPIIDIAEPLTATATSASGNALLVEEDPLVPIATLPSPAKARWRQERDRILDMLEEEEQLEQLREEQIELGERQEIMRKRREAAANEKEKLRAAKEMQKKMGKALLRNMAEARAKEDAAAALSEPISNNDSAPEKKSQGVKKKVAFTGLPEDKDEVEPPKISSNESEQSNLDWGDVMPARLRSKTRSSLLPPDNLPMKSSVIERISPGTKAVLPDNAVYEPDSDDESSPESPVHADDDSDTFQPRDSDDAVHRAPPDSDTDSNEDPVLEEEYDLDFAQHQREIVLQYHEKRSKMGETASVAMMSQSHGGDEDSRVDIPLDMPSTDAQLKPSISHFKANRLASSYNATTPTSSTSLGGSVLPASSARTLQRAIRTGKLDSDERLVGRDHDSASEDENEGMQEVLDLLKKGEVYNLGPDGNYIHTIPPRSIAAQSTAPSTALSHTAADVKPSQLPPISRPKTSKFKLSRAQAGRAPTASAISPPSSEPGSGSHTPISGAGRSSPKISSTITPTVAERHSPLGELAPGSSAISPTTPTVADSPSLPSSNSGMVQKPMSKPARDAPPFSTIVDSPSFARPTARGPPIIVASPSFPSPAQQTSRPARPPIVMSSAVRESGALHQPPGTPDAAGGARPEKKISRFMADRM